MIKKAIESFGNWVLPNGLFDAFRFEFRSQLGRLMTGPLDIERHSSRYLNLGCGNVYVPGMINADFFTNRKKDYGMDLRYPFKIPSDSMDGVFSDHTMEHLSYAELQNALSECFRILKPGGTIRIIVPDMSIFVRKYCENDEEWFATWKTLVLGPQSRAKYRPLFTKMFALNFTSSFYFHKTSWDLEVAQLLLTAAGFSEIKECAFMQGTNGLLSDKSNEDRRLISLYVEAKKA